MIKRYTISVFVTATFLLFYFNVYAQQSQYSFRRIDISNGLSNNQVNTIFEDNKGFMWFGTISGLDRYDGHSFKIYKNDVHNAASLKDNYVKNICELPDHKLWIKSVSNQNSVYDELMDNFLADPSLYFKSLQLPEANLSGVLNLNGIFWFFYESAGIYTIKPGQSAHHLTEGEKKYQIKDPFISDVQIDANKNIWVLHQNGLIEKIDPLTEKVILRSEVLKVKAEETKTQNFSFYVDRSYELWIYATITPMGCFHFNPIDNSLEQFTRESGKARLNNNIVKTIVEDNEGLIWIGTDHGGVNILNKKNFQISYIKNEIENTRSLSENSVYCLYKSRIGLIWAGTFKGGVNFYNPNAINFPLYKNHLSDKNSLPFSDVNRFAEDEKGNLWIGSNGGGLFYFNRKTNTYRVYKHDPSNPGSLTNDIIVGLYYSKDHLLWIGTYFGGMDCFDGKTFHHFKHDASQVNSIADDRIWDITEERNGNKENLWVATLGGGLDLYNRKEKRFYHHQVNADSNSVYSNDIAHITEDYNRNLWVATAWGVDVLNLRTNNFSHYSDLEHKLSNPNVNSIFCDNKGLVWAGTREGLDVFNSKTKQFQSFTIADGLPHNNILNIVEDNSGYLWLSTPNGISRVTVNKDPQQHYSIFCRNFNATDGLQSSEFNPNAAFKTSSGEILFGGPSGFNLFNPNSIKDVNNKVDVVFTDFQILNKSIVPGEKVNGRVVMNESITTAREITLNYNQDIFSIEFASLNYIDPDKNKYAYKLDGFNKDWVYVDQNNKKVTYTNLNPGTYTFYVKTANDIGKWSDATAKLQIIILPPFWRTGIAYFIYILLILGILYFSRRYILLRAREKFKIEQERREASRMHELDLMKIKFLTNVSHEFRTPLSLIIAPLDKLISVTADKQGRSQFELMQRNARRLLNLVNQLLDFRKLETQEIKLNTSKADIIRFLKDISYSFMDMAEKKEIKFSFQAANKALFTLFDPDKLERIMFNLLSNAFKFTQEHGKIEISVQSRELPNGENTALQQLLEIKVTDSGIGIPLEKQDKIFERFFQNEIPGSMLNQGSGIGLSITKEFVKLHGGNITVKSEPGKGSVFTVEIPIIVLEEQLTPLNEQEHQVATGNHEEIEYLTDSSLHEIPVPVLSSKKLTLLIIEDNEDFRFYLKDNLKAMYNIIEASNGKSGWQKALQFHPALIVSDIIMPEMDGIELCRKIKTDPRTSSIPVILLTAKTTDENRLEGYQTGASDYITKPFNFEILQSRIKNLLNQQATLRKTFEKKVEAQPADIQVISENEKFISLALEIVEKNMDNDAFSVEELSKKLFISRVGLYKKLFAITGKTPIEFIRSIRLKRAAQLLEKTNMTISEIAFEVGFNNPKYFARYFKAEYGKLPSVYQSEQQKNS